jgi:hypothetical protein
MLTRLAVLGRARYRAVRPIRTRSDLLRLLTTRIALVPIAALAVILAGIGDFAGITVVRVDAAEHPAVDGDRVLDNDMARPAVARTVAAVADDLAVVLGEEVLDTYRAAAVELEDLVFGPEGTATVDVGCAGGLLQGCGVLADVFPPDVVEGAFTQLEPAVDLSRVDTYQVPLQWTPSAWLFPIMTLESVAPFSRMNMASFSPVSDWP